MSHGLEVYDAAGNTVLTVTDKAPRVLFQREVPVNDTGSDTFVVPDTSRLKGFSVLTSSSYFAACHKVDVIGNTVQWSLGSTQDATGPSIIFVVAY